jgi:hypothetical protein
MDGSLRLREADRRAARSPNSPRAHPGDERRQLPPQAKPPQKESTHRTLTPSNTLGVERPLPLRSRALSSPEKPSPAHLLLVPNSSATMAPFHSALDIFDLKWLLLIPALPTMGFVAWSY